MNNTDRRGQESKYSYWRCHGSKGHPHPVEYVTGYKCPQCGKSRPQSPDSLSPPVTSTSVAKPERDRSLFAAIKAIKREPSLFPVVILTIGSGYTTLQGASQILPKFVAYPSGFAIQVLLFLLVSGFTLKKVRCLKWLAVGILSVVSIYTSFFAYYDFLVSEKREEDNLSRAISAHQNLVADVFIPIQEKANQLKRQIEIKDRHIDDEVAGERRSGLVGCGEICQSLKAEREDLKDRYEQIYPIVVNLEPFFQYDLEGKQPADILKADLDALKLVPQNCLPKEPEFSCLPEQYKGILNPLDSRHTELRSKYLDEASRISVLAPFLKIRKRETAAIAAVLAAIVVDGIIILFAAGIEVRQRPKEITLILKSKGSEFLDELIESIDELTIDHEQLQNTSNGNEYIKLLQKIQVETQWIRKEEDEWLITSSEANTFLKWITEERERLIRKNKSDQNFVYRTFRKLFTFTQKPDQSTNDVVFRIPPTEI